MLESPKKMGRGCLSPSHLFGITLLLNVMLMKSRLIMILLSRMMRTHFANAVGLEKASKGFPRSLRRKKVEKLKYRMDFLSLSLFVIFASLLFTL